MLKRTIRIRPHRVAAPAPQGETPAQERRGRLPPEVDAFCCDWGSWVATRKLAAPRPLTSVLGRLRLPTGSGDGPRVRMDPHLAAFDVALRAQGERAQAVLFGLYALPRIVRQRVPVKLLATELHMSRQHVYRVRDDAALAAYAHRFAVLAREQPGTGTSAPAAAAWSGTATAAM